MDIDDRLGMSTLVSAAVRPHPTLDPPVAKSRVTVEQWSTNNGSIIYANSHSGSGRVKSEGSGGKSSTVVKTMGKTLAPNVRPNESSSSETSSRESFDNNEKSMIVTNSKIKPIDDCISKVDLDLFPDKKDINEVSSHDTDHNIQANSNISVDRKYLFMLF